MQKERRRKTIYLDPQEEHKLREEAFNARVSESKIVREYLKQIYGIKKPYCTRSNVDACINCSLTNYGKDCRNKPID